MHPEGYLQLPAWARRQASVVFMFLTTSVLSVGSEDKDTPSQTDVTLQPVQSPAENLHQVISFMENFNRNKKQMQLKFLEEVEDQVNKGEITEEEKMERMESWAEQWKEIESKTEALLSDSLDVLDVISADLEDSPAKHDRILADFGRASLPHAEVMFSACRWHGDAGVGGRVVLSEDVAVELWPCGLTSFASVACIIHPLRSFLLDALGPLDVLRFAADAGAGDAMDIYLKLFAEAAARSFAAYKQDWSPVGAEQGHANCRRFLFHQRLCQNMCVPRVSMWSFCDREHKLSEKVLLDALAAASVAASPDKVARDDLDEDLNEDLDEVFNEAKAAQLASADHAALAYVTGWMRNQEGDYSHIPCEDEPELHGYDCRTFMYGSTYFHSWLRVMRFPAVSRAVSFATAKEGRHEIVILGSSLGWQTLWATLTFGIQAVGYELHEVRINFAKLAASQVQSASGTAQFHHADALQANVSSAAIIYLTDLLWPADLIASLASLIKSQLLASKDRGEGVIIVSNQEEVWHEANFSSLGKIEVAVTWTKLQAFFFWGV